MLRSDSRDGDWSIHVWWRRMGWEAPSISPSSRNTTESMEISCLISMPDLDSEHLIRAQSINASALPGSSTSGAPRALAGV